MSVASPKTYRDQWDDEIDLRELMRVIVKRKGLIAGLVAVAVMVSGFLSFFVLPPVYQAEAVLQLPSVQSGGVTDYTLEAIAAMGTSPLVLGRVANALPGVTSAEVARALTVTLDAPARLLRGKAEAGTAADAHMLLSAWTEVFISSVAESVTEVARERLALAEEELFARHTELEQAREAMRRFEAENALNMLEVQLANLEAELIQANQRIRDLELYTIPADQERLAYLQTELEGQPQTMEVDGSPGYVMGSSQQSGEALLAGGSVINPTYLHIQQSIVETSERLATNRSVLASLRRFVSDAPAEMDALRSELARLRDERDELEAQLAVAQQRYQSAQSEHTDWSKWVASSSAASPRIVSEPTLPTSPVRPRKMLNIALAAFLATFVGVGLTFLLEIWHSGERQEQAKPGV